MDYTIGIVRMLSIATRRSQGSSQLCARDASNQCVTLTGCGLHDKSIATEPSAEHLLTHTSEREVIAILEIRCLIHLERPIEKDRFAGLMDDANAEFFSGRNLATTTE